MDTPQFDADTNTISLPAVKGVEYKIDGYPVEGEVKIVRDTTVSVRAARGYKLHPDIVREHTFKFQKPEAPAKDSVDKNIDETNKVVAGADAQPVEQQNLSTNRLTTRSNQP